MPRKDGNKTTVVRCDSARLCERSRKWSENLRLC